MLSYNQLKYSAAAVAMCGIVGAAADAHAQAAATMNVTLTVDNTVNIATTDVNFGTIAVSTSGVGADPDGTLQINTGGALTPTGAAGSTIFTVGGTPAAGNYAITGAAGGSTLNLDVTAGGGVSDLTFGGQTLTVTQVVFNDGGGPQPFTPGAGLSTTTTASPTGTASIDVGMTIQADSGQATYASGAYTGAIVLNVTY